MRKRALSRVIAVLLCTSFVMTGCGKDSKDSKQTETTTQAVVQETTTEAVVELKGQEIAPEIATQLNVVEDNNRNYYEIFVASFCDSNGDGMGDINGLISKLDYINDGNPETDTDLGCNGIWLMPINPSPTYHKYDVMDYCDIDPAYGTLDDFKRLVEECHKRGIKIITDLVMNHSSIGNDWFQQAKKYLNSLPQGAEPDVAQCPYVDYYNFVKGEQAGNYYSLGNDYYYEAVFSQGMPELNLESPAVRAEFEKICKFWLDMGVDGFRLDAAKEYYSGNTPKCVEVLTWLENYVTSVNPDAYIVAETWAADYDAYLASGIDSAFDFSYSSFDGNIALTVQGNDSTYNGLYFAKNMVQSYERTKEKGENSIMATFLSNHDLNRPAHYLAFDDKKIKFSHGMLSLLNGSTFIYYGDEIGLGGTGADENKRSPMVWSASNKEGLTNGPADMAKDYVINKFAPVDEQLNDKNSILSYVKQSVKLRNIFPEISRGVPEVITSVTDENVCAVKKTLDGSHIIILANTNPEKTAYVELPRQANGYKCIQGMLTVDEIMPKQVEDTIVLPARSIVVLK